jgi:hypothetical protein
VVVIIGLSEALSLPCAVDVGGVGGVGDGVADPSYR